MNKMAQRLIRAGLLDSEKINSLSDSEQMFFVRLMLIVDDAGNCDARSIYIRSNCYPVSEVTVEKVEKMLISLEKQGLIEFYYIDGKKYLHIPKFGQRLRTIRYRVPCQQNVARTEVETKRREEEDNTIASWRTDFKIYEKEVSDAYDELMADQEWLDERRRYHPNLDIGLTMQKAFNDFWGIEAGWEHKKSKRIKTIDWKRTFTNALTIKGNQVWQKRPQIYSQ